MTGEVHVGGELELIGSSEGLRTVSKIAYAGLVFRAGARLAMGDAFKEIRAYIVEGTGKPTARSFVNYKFSDAVQQTLSGFRVYPACTSMYGFCPF